MDNQTDDRIDNQVDDPAVDQMDKKNKRAFRNGMLIALSLAVVLVIILCFLFDPRGVAISHAPRWSLGNFALMDIVIFEAFMLLFGGFVTVTRKERREEEENAVDVRWIPRLLSIPVMVVSLVLFVFVENIDFLPLVYFDEWTWAFVVLVIIQTVLVFLSKKRYDAKKDVQTEKA